MRTLVVLVAASLAVACATPALPAAAPAASGASREGSATTEAPDRAAPTPDASEEVSVGVPGAAVGFSVDAVEAAYADLAAGLAARPGLPAFAGPLANWPIIGRISSPFGPRWGGFHNGLDIAAPMYTPVRAAAAGQVVTVGKPSLVYGDTATIVIIVHGKDFATVYAHLSDDRPPPVRIGQQVAAGEVIAYNGSTGWSTGPHVHFMTIVDGRAADPRRYLP